MRKIRPIQAWIKIMKKTMKNQNNNFYSHLNLEYKTVVIKRVFDQ